PTRTTRLPYTTLFRSELTEQGRALFAEAKAVLDNAKRFSSHARLLASGEETRLRILVDVLFPRDLLNETLSAFARAHPRTRVQLDRKSTRLNSSHVKI